MSSRPEETQTLDIDLSRAQRWVVHYVLTARADEAIDDRTKPPTWLVNAFEAIEAGERTLTVHQARNLRTAVHAYSTAADTHDADVEHAASIVGRLDAALESR